MKGNASVTFEEHETVILVVYESWLCFGMRLFANRDGAVTETAPLDRPFSVRGETQ